MLTRRFLYVLVLAAPLAVRGQAQDTQELVRQALWGTGEAKAQALVKLRSLPMDPEGVQEVERVIRAGRAYGPVAESPQTLAVAIDRQRQVNVLVQVPSSYAPKKRYPLMIAIGGGPAPNEQGAKSRAKSMLGLWSKPAAQAGWLVAAVEDTVSIRLPGKELRYHVLYADHLRAIRDALIERYAIDPNRICVTGISLGSNYALAYATAHPDWFAGIAPVSTEGESREHVVRNLQHMGVFVLEGAKDKNIRTIEGPRKLSHLLKDFDYPHRYEEDPNKGHEGFVDKYPEVLKWFSEISRPAFPRTVIRLPHPAIMMPSKRFYWLEGDTHQACFAAKVEGNAIEIQAARVRRLTMHLSDQLVDLGKPVVIRVNGHKVREKTVERSLAVAVEDTAALNDTERFATARITVDVPDLEAGSAWLATMAPRTEPTKLPFWEDFALMTLKDERPLLDLELARENERVAARVKAAPEGSGLHPGDLIVEFDQEPLFAGGVQFLQDYLLRTRSETVELRIVRQGKTEKVSYSVQPRR